MTFSGDFDPKPVIELVKRELKKAGLFLNTKKTVVVRKGQKQMVTGIVVNEKKSVPSEYKSKVRQEMYYCMKYGVLSHVVNSGISDEPHTYACKLLGRVNYVLSVEPDNKAMTDYKSWLQQQIKLLKNF